MADKVHAERDQVFSGELPQHLTIDFVVSECSLILPKANAAQPVPDIHGQIPSFRTRRG